MQEVVGAVLARVRQRDPQRRIQSRVPGDLPLVRVDAGGGTIKAEASEQLAELAELDAQRAAQQQAMVPLQQEIERISLLPDVRRYLALAAKLRTCAASPPFNTVKSVCTGLPWVMVPVLSRAR